MKHVSRDRTIIGTTGAVLIVAGVAGFAGVVIPGVSGVNVTHDALHLISGLFAIRVSLLGKVSACMCCRVMGVLYALVATLGFIADNSAFPVNASDNVFHLVVAAIFLFIGYREVMPHDHDEATSPI
jgi:ABC-type uncharacterized transport system permease subunit